MIEIILSLVGGLKGLILGGIGLVGGLFALFWKARFNSERKAKEEFMQANRIYEARDKVYRKDQKIQVDTEKKVEEVREKVKEAGSPEAGAEVVSGAINDYFSGEKR